MQSLLGKNKKQLSIWIFNKKPIVKILLVWSSSSKPCFRKIRIWEMSPNNWKC